MNNFSNTHTWHLFGIPDRFKRLVQDPSVLLDVPYSPILSNQTLRPLSRRCNVGFSTILSQIRVQLSRVDSPSSQPAQQIVGATVSQPASMQASVFNFVTAPVGGPTLIDDPIVKSHNHA